MNGAEGQLGHQGGRSIGQLYTPAEDGNAKAIGVEDVRGMLNGNRMHVGSGWSRALDKSTSLSYPRTATN